MTHTELRALCEEAGPAKVEYYAPTNGLGVPRWSVNGWVRSTSIADEVEGGPFRMEGPTKRAADSMAARLNAVPELLDENEKLRAALREACDIATQSSYAVSHPPERTARIARISELRSHLDER